MLAVAVAPPGIRPRQFIPAMKKNRERKSGRSLSPCSFSMFG